ncbi:MAG: hypothetical protein B6D56_06675, partial [Candidatus Omnitrophica bacterium 4484_70.1]
MLRWADKNAYALVVKPFSSPSQILIIKEKEEVPLPWYPEKRPNVLIVGKPETNEKYDEYIREIALKYGYKDIKKFEERYKDSIFIVKETEKGNIYSKLIFTDKGRKIVWIIRYLERETQRVVTEAIAEGKTITREIIPYIVSIIQYGKNNKGKEIEKGADTYLLAKRLEEFRKVDTNKERLIKELLEEREIRVSLSELLNIILKEKSLSKIQKIIIAKLIHQIENTQFSLKTPFKISHSEVIDFNKLKEKQMIQKIVREIIQKEGFRLPQKLSKLKWVKITNYDPSGKEYIWEIQAFGKSSLPLVKIKHEKVRLFGKEYDTGKLIDIVFEYKGKKVSLRFDLGKEKIEPVAVSSYAKFPTEKIVVNFYKELVFIDVRNKTQGYWEARKHLRKNNLFAENWLKVLTNLDKIAKNRVERVESFVFTEKYPLLSSLLKALDVPFLTFTSYYIHNKETSPVLIGLGVLEKIDWQKGLIASFNKVIFYGDEKGTQIITEANYRAWRDFKGNVRVQAFVSEEGAPTLAIFVFNFDKYGIGKNSVVFVNTEEDKKEIEKVLSYLKKRGELTKEEEKYLEELLREKGGFRVLRVAKYTGTKRAQLLDIRAQHPISTRLFEFEVVKGLWDYKITLSQNQDLVSNYPYLRNRIDKFFKLESNNGYLTALQTRYRIYKSGEGKLMVRLEGYELDKNGNIKGRPKWITFILYNTEILSATEAGPLHFGYGEEAYTYKYKNSLDSSKYVKNNWSKSNWLSKTYNRRIDEEGIVYKVESKIDYSVEIGTKMDGRMNYQVFKGIEGIFKTIFDELELPTKTYISTKEGWKLYTLNDVEFINYKDVYYFVVIERLISKDWSNWLKTFGKRIAIFENGRIFYAKRTPFEVKTTYSRVLNLSLSDKQRSSIVGNILRIIKYSKGDRIIKNGSNISNNNDKVKTIKRYYNGKEPVYRPHWFSSLNSVLVNFGVILGLILGVILIPLIGYFIVFKIYRILVARGFDVNKASIEDFISIGFIPAVALAIVLERKIRGPFKNYRDLKTRLDLIRFRAFKDEEELLKKISTIDNEEELSELLGFSIEDTQNLIDKRRTQGGFKDYEDLVKAIIDLGISKDINTFFRSFHPLSMNTLKRKYQLRKLKSALRFIEKDKFYKYTREDVFDKNTREDLRNTNSIEEFFNKLWSLYEKEEEKVGFESFINMVKRFLNIEEVLEVVSDSYALRLEDKVSRERAFRIIIRRIYEKIKDKQEFKEEIEKRLESWINNLRLKEHPLFKDEINKLKKTFLINTLKVEFLPEEFKFGYDDILSDFILYSWDDLEKSPVMDKTFTYALVSFERLFFMQFIIEKGLGALVGQGRLEDYLWIERIKPVLESKDFNKLVELVLNLKKVRDIFTMLMGEEIAKWEENRDPQGRVKHFKAIITEEVLNPAIRFLLGIKELSFGDENSWRLSKDTYKKLRPFKEEFDNLLDEIFNLPLRDGEIDKERAKDTIKYIIHNLRNLILQIVHTVEREEKIPVVKTRLSYWKINVLPVFYMFKYFKKIFTRGGPYNRSFLDVMRHIYNIIVILVTSGFMSYLLTKVVLKNLPLLGIPYVIKINPSIPLGIFSVLILLNLLWSLYLRFLRKRYLSEDRNSSISEIVENQNKFRKAYKIGLIVKSLFLIASFVVGYRVFPWIFSEIPFLSSLAHAHMYMLPSILRMILEALPWLIFIATWRLSLYSVNYLFMAIVQGIENWKNNVYEVVRNDTRKIKKRLVALFLDETPAYFKRHKTRGQELIDDFNILLKELKELGLLDKEYKIDYQDAKSEEILLNKIDEIIQASLIKIKGYEKYNKNNLVIQRIREWINEHYRIDKADEPRNKTELIPLSVGIAGFREDIYFGFDDLLKYKDDDVTHRLGLLARYKNYIFIKMVENFVTDFSQQEELLKLIENPTYQLKNIPEVLKKKIEIWANIHLQTVWNNARTAKIRHRDILKNYYYQFYTDEELNNVNIDEEIENKIRVFPRHIQSLQIIDKALNGRFREFIDYLIENNWNLDKAKEFIVENILKKNKNEVKDFEEAVEQLGLGRSLKELLKLIVKEKLWLTMVKDSTEQYHGAKWSAFTASLPHLIGPFILTVDADHRFYHPGSRFTYTHLMEAYLNPGLGASIPVIYHSLTENLGEVGKIVPVGENGFYFHTQGGKHKFGGLGAYGKFIIRIRALRWSEGITDSYVAEDIMTVIRFLSFGYIVGRASYIKIEKGWPYQFSEIRNPIRKWSYDAYECVLGRVSLFSWLSPFVPIPYLINNLFLDGFGFYFKKPSVTSYIKWIIVVFMILDWNIFNGVALSLWISSLVLSQAISLSLLFYRVYDEGKGWIKGLFQFLFLDIMSIIIPRRMYIFYVHHLGVYEETIGIIGPERNGKFISTTGKAGNISRDNDPRDIYIRSYYPIIKGAFWTFIIFNFVGFSIVKTVAFILIFWLPIVWVMAPFWFNPRENRKQFIKDIWWGLYYGFFLGLIDAFYNIEYKLNPFIRKEEDKIQRMIVDLYTLCHQKENPIPLQFSAYRWIHPIDKTPIRISHPHIQEVSLFHIWPSFYRSSYTKVPYPVMDKAWEGMIEELNKYNKFFNYLREYEGLKSKVEEDVVKILLRIENIQGKPTEEIKAILNGLSGRFKNIKEKLEQLEKEGKLDKKILNEIIKDIKKGIIEEINAIVSDKSISEYILSCSYEIMNFYRGVKNVKLSEDNISQKFGEFENVLFEDAKAIFNSINNYIYPHPDETELRIETLKGRYNLLSEVTKDENKDISERIDNLFEDLQNKKSKKKQKIDMIEELDRLITQLEWSLHELSFPKETFPAKAFNYLLNKSVGIQDFIILVGVYTWLIAGNLRIIFEKKNFEQFLNQSTSSSLKTKEQVVKHSYTQSFTTQTIFQNILDMLINLKKYTQKSSSAINLKHPYTKKVYQSFEKQIHSMQKELDSKKEEIINNFSLDTYIVAKDNLDIILNKVEKSLFIIDERILNNEIHPEYIERLRLNKQDKPQILKEETIRFAVYSLAGDPLHWGHYIVPLVLIADKNILIDGVIVLVQGRDIRKQRLTQTEDHRHTIIPQVYKYFSPFVRCSPLGYRNYDIGEVRLGRLLALNKDQQKIVYYVAGADHFNRYVIKDGVEKPDTVAWLEAYQEMNIHKLKEFASLMMPKEKELPGIAQHIEEWAKELEEIDSREHEIKGIFIERGEEKVDVNRIENLNVEVVSVPPIMEMSSTEIREENCFWNMVFEVYEYAKRYPSLRKAWGIETSSSLMVTSDCFFIYQNILNQMQLMSQELNIPIIHSEFQNRLTQAKEYLQKIEKLIHQEKINPFIKIRTQKEQPSLKPISTVIRIGIYPCAANPLHWDHLLVGLKVIAEQELDKVIFVIQGPDERKPILVHTQKYRFELTPKVLA